METTMVFYWGRVQKHEAGTRHRPQQLFYLISIIIIIVSIDIWYVHHHFKYEPIKPD